MTKQEPPVPIIRIVKGYAGNYLYQLQNPIELNITMASRWYFRYWTLDPNLIFIKLKEIAK